MKYFDFHTHTFLKTHLNVDDIANAKSPMEDFDAKTVLNFDELMGDVLDSQSSGSQLFKGNGKLIVVTLYALENAYAKSKIVKTVLSISKDLSKKLIKAIRNEEISYWELLERELNHAKDFENVPFEVAGNNIKYKFINAISEYDDAATDTIYFILAVEGGHCFYGNKAVLNQNMPDILAKLGEFKSKTNLTKPRLSHITLTHHAQNIFANHAFAMPSAWSGDGAKNPQGGYNPIGNGLTADGITFIKEALREDVNNYRILLDMKHLSFGSRVELYDLMQNEFPKVPIVATHMGVTGLSMSQTTYKREGEDTNVIRNISTNSKDNRCHEVQHNQIFSYEFDGNTVCFNPWSINLYDEEITTIINSGEKGGLIGLSLDTRILGRTDGSNYHLPELFSKFDKNNVIIPSPFIDIDAPFLVRNYLNNPDFFEDNNFPIDNRLPHTDGIYYFVNNLLHIAKITGDVAWERVCIGSDYDGLIEAISDVPTAAFIPSFYQKLERVLPQIADIQGVTLPFGVNILLDNLFFDNAKRFFDQNFK